MTSPIISVNNLSKSYLVGHQAKGKETYTALRDVLGRNAGNFVRKSVDMFRGRLIIQGDEVEEFWALRNVSFEINEGEVVGVIGRNGAGKSTLLKILSRITEPTTGRATLRGRVASLLEVGTGFHPELTGRENIFLNGAILGMSRAEIKRKFDEIVEFAEVEKFLDTPVKRYSSGMYVRLAFAVAAHLDPEVMVVDEVLAVGDIRFQTKCLSKMEAVGKSGRTVIFVSHNLSAVRRLCTRTIYLSEGEKIGDGPTDKVLEIYQRHSSPVAEQLESSIAQKIGSFPPDPDCTLLGITVSQARAFPPHIESAAPIIIRFDYKVLKDVWGIHAFFRLFDDDGVILFEGIDIAEYVEIPTLSPGVYSSTATLPANLFTARRYELHMGLAISGKRYCTPELLVYPFEVELTGRINQCFREYSSPGKLLPSIPWQIERHSAE